MTVDTFYHSFEAAFRGSREEIHERLSIYLPFIRPFIGFLDSPSALDLGCGRGEWLQLLREVGLSGHGIDLDDAMLEDCSSHGLSVEKGDAIDCLRTLPDNSKSIISGFHIAEHLSFDQLRALITEAFRVLTPGGLLILETPNAENIRVGTLTFHMDPTHVRPLPPGLLSFLVRYAGFYRMKLLRLQENAELRLTKDVRLLHVLEGVSPDYAVVAQKNAEPSILREFQAAFSVDTGLTLDTLAQRFEDKLVQRSEFLRELERISGTLTHLQRTQDSLLVETSQHIVDYQRRLDEVYSSSSWRITSPLREIRLRVRPIINAALELSVRRNRYISRAISLVLNAVVKNSLVAVPARRFLAYFPKSRALLKRLRDPETIGHAESTPPVHVREIHLTPRGKKIFAQLIKRRDH
jgi:O-antigen chain-terminating methyltransferase